jgi:uncharacterized protein YbjT (DUF2867 family)
MIGTGRLLWTRQAITRRASTHRSADGAGSGAFDPSPHDHPCGTFFPRVRVCTDHLFPGAKKMRIAVLGASGGIGSWFVRLAHGAGHEVRALVRPATEVQGPEDAVVLRGEALNRADLERTVEGADAVVCCLGQRRASRNPWSRAFSPADLMERVAASLIPAMENAGVQPFIFVSAGGAGESRAQLSPTVGWLVRRGRIGGAYRDLEAMEARIARSRLDWTAVRPVTLVDGPLTGRARPVEHYTMFSTVRRSDVAAYLLHLLEGRREADARAVLLGS